MVALELETLFERGKIDRDPAFMLANLESSMSLGVSETAFATIVDRARTFAWTRDPFDRLIVANAMAEGNPSGNGGPSDPGDLQGRRVVSRP